LFFSNPSGRECARTATPCGSGRFVFPGTRLRTLQARAAIPYYPFSIVQRQVVLLSGLVIVLLLPLAWLGHRTRLLSLTVVIVPTLVANAFVTAVFSVVDGRYQARVIWHIPLLAAVMALDLFTQKPTARGPRHRAASRP
jgi:hypothetical protein